MSTMVHKGIPRDELRRLTKAGMLEWDGPMPLAFKEAQRRYKPRTSCKPKRITIPSEPAMVPPLGKPRKESRICICRGAPFGTFENFWLCPLHRGG